MNGRNLIKIHNCFDLVLTNTQTGEERKYHTENIVLDQFYTSRIYNSYNGRVDTIQLGTGVGTLSTSRTSLFSRLTGHTWSAGSGNTVCFSEVAQLSKTRFKWSLLTTFVETEANGDLTEVGLAISGNNNGLVTHALFTDSENNPITITKTNVDRLTITATVFAEFTISGWIQPFGISYRGEGVTNPACLCNTKIDYEESAPWSVSGPFNATTGNTEVNTRRDNMSRFSRWICGFTGNLVGSSQGATSNNLNIHYYLVTIPPSNSHPNDGTLTNGYRRFEPQCYYLSGSTKTYYTLASGLFRAELNGQYNSGNGNIVISNVTYTYQIKAIGNDGLFYIPLPNHDVFPPKQLTFELTADGTSTGYNLGVPELMTSDVEVRIDGVLQDPSTYTFYGKDFNLKQAWASADTKYIKESQIFWDPDSGSGTCRFDVPFPCYGSSSSTTGTWGRVYDGNGGPAALIYDFGSPKTVDTLASIATSTLSYSTDGTTWTQVASITKTPQSNDHPVIYQQFTPMSARYWKVTLSGRWNQDPQVWDNPLIALFSEFDLMKPQIEFNNPPASGAVIQVKAYTEYPIKNQNWIINGTVIDGVIQRGSGQ